MQVARLQALALADAMTLPVDCDWCTATHPKFQHTGKVRHFVAFFTAAVRGSSALLPVPRFGKTSLPTFFPSVNLSSHQ